MDVKEFWSKTSSWIKTHKISTSTDYHPHINDQGLISPDVKTAETSVGGRPLHSKHVIVKTIPPMTTEAMAIAIISSSSVKPFFEVKPVRFAVICFFCIVMA